MTLTLGVNGIRLITMRSGVGRHLENVLRSWSGLEHAFDEVRVYTPKPIEPELDLGRLSRRVVVPSLGPYGWWEQYALPRAHGDRDVLVCPSNVAPLQAKCPILLIHHGSYEGYPQAFGWWRRTKAYWAYRLSARRAEVVVTVSESSKRDIVRFYGVSPEKVEVVPDGVDLDVFHPIDDDAALSEFRTRVLGVDEPFLLYVGKPVRRHNIESMLLAYARLRNTGQLEHRFLFIGAALPGLRVESLVQSLGLESQVELVGHASHEFINLALNASSLLLYPSDYEGFGMPVLEAMACGTPVIALDNTALPEFAGGVAYLAENGETETLMAAIVHVLGDAALRRRMREAGPRRARGYEWRIVAERIIRLAERLAVTSVGATVS